MSLKEKINNDIKEAMKARDKNALKSLRSIKSAILLAETDGSGKEVGDAEVTRIIQKLAKQRQESYDLYVEQNRTDLANIEKDELEVLEEYLPKQMDEGELKDFLSNLVSDLNAEGMKDMGRVMGEAQKKLAGRADGKTVSSVVRELLSN
ncbi:MAG: GatB/YqeY domain-containing protein [Saprospirales bacterium]|nr:MAG: GatB/YqeY domain-containing protein [Saprospirales bacterium]